jgi:hypothetical protein
MVHVRPSCCSWTSVPLWLPGLYPGITEIHLLDISIQEVTACCKLLFGKVLFTESKEGPLDIRSGLVGRWLINFQPLCIMSYQFCWQYEAQWFPALWTQLACDGCRHLSEVNSLLGYWYQFSLHFDTSLGAMVQMLEYHWCLSGSSDAYCVVPMCHVYTKIGMMFPASEFVTKFFETPLC